MTDTTPQFDKVPAKEALRRQFMRLIVYYVSVAAALVVLSAIVPNFFDHLPIGGVSEIIGNDQSTLALEDALLSGDDEVVSELIANGAAVESRFADAKALALAMLGTIVVMLPVSWIYKSIHVQGDYDHSMDETALILPAVVAGIVLIVQHSLALAFSLAGIVAGVRFRRALSDTFDTLFIFVAIGVGIAAGVKALEIAAVMTVFFTFATVLVCLFGDGLESHHAANEKLAKRARKLQRKATSENSDEQAPDAP
ncbi:MAG: DUF4956 domain-containing protein [Pseudomonadota bacterium]